MSLLATGEKPKCKKDLSGPGQVFFYNSYSKSSVQKIRLA